jgi:hypothetical protein
MNNTIKEIQEYALSDGDINKYLPNVKIILYNDLKNYNNIDELLPNKNSYFILLYQDSETTGHWTAVLRQNNTVEFFDPYGNYPDTQLKWTDKETRESIGIEGKYLSRLFDRSKLNVVYNTEDYQKEKAGINTCGRHVVYRLKNNHLPLKQYHIHIRNESKKNNCDYDCTVTKKINIIE